MLRVGIAGIGGISGAHIRAWKGIAGAEIAAVTDIRPEMAEKGAAETGAKIYRDYDAMLDGADLDAIDICLPTYLHADCAVRALDRGIHVLTEKPVSLRRDDVRRLYGAAKANDRRFMVAQVLRFWREYVILREAILSGRYGRLLSGQMSRLNRTPDWSWDDWMRDPERSGLTPFDLHIHDLDFLVYTMGEPRDLVCRRARTASQDYFCVVYDYPGCFISTEAAWYDCDYPFQAGYRFQFERAVMEYRGGVLKIYPAGGGDFIPGIDESAGITEDAYYNEIRYFADCVLSGKDCDRIKPGELECVLDVIGRIDRASFGG